MQSTVLKPQHDGCSLDDWESPQWFAVFLWKRRGRRLRSDVDVLRFYRFYLYKSAMTRRPRTPGVRRRKLSVHRRILIFTDSTLSSQYIFLSAELEYFHVAVIVPPHRSWQIFPIFSLHHCVCLKRLLLITFFWNTQGDVGRVTPDTVLSGVFKKSKPWPQKKYCGTFVSFIDYLTVCMSLLLYNLLLWH